MRAAPRRVAKRALRVFLFLAVVLASAGARPAFAKGCRIRLTAEGPFRGTVLDRGRERFSRFAVKIDYSMDTPDIKAVYDKRALSECSSEAGSVKISADNTNGSPLMYLLLNEIGKAAWPPDVTEPAKVQATYKEFGIATRQLQFGTLRPAIIEIGLTAAWDVIKASVPGISFPVELGGEFLIELTKEYVKGGDGTDITKWLKWKIPTVVQKAGLGNGESDVAKDLVQALEKGAAEFDNEYSRKIEPVVVTGRGEAGACTIYYNAAIDLRRARYHVTFDKFCGEWEDTLELTAKVTVPREPLEPGQKGRVTAQVLGGTKKLPVTLTTAHTNGLNAVTSGVEAKATITGKLVTFTFDVAKVRKDDTYTFKVFLTTPAGSPAPATATVTVKNVAPEIQAAPESRVQNKPGEFTKWRGKVQIRDRNADSKNSGEISAAKLTTGGHPNGLETTHKKKKFDQKNCRGPNKDGVYMCDVSLVKGRIRKPHEHGVFSTKLMVSDDADLAATPRKIEFEVLNVPPVVTKINPFPDKFEQKKRGQVGITAILRDDNGAKDIEDVRMNAEPAGGKKLYVLREFKHNKDALPDGARELEITLEKKFLNKDEEGKWPISLEAFDGEHWSKPRVGNITVGNLPPTLCASGIVYGTDLGPARSLCPGEEFTIGVCAKDYEDTLEVTVGGAGQNVTLRPGGGKNNYVGTLRAPLKPGHYEYKVTIKETSSTNKKFITRIVPIDVVDCDEGATDWTSSVNVEPQEVCPGEAFTVMPVATLFMKDKKKVDVHPESTVSFLGAQEKTSAKNPGARFSAPKNPGQYPIRVDADILDIKTTMNANVRVRACATDIEDDIIDILRDPGGWNVVPGERDPSVQAMMCETSFDATANSVGDASVPRRLTPGRLLHAMRAWLRPSGYEARLHASAGYPGHTPLTPSRSETQSPSATSFRPIAFLTSNGNSSGEAFDIQIFNEGGFTQQILGEGVVIEPLKKKAQEKVQKELEKWVGKPKLEAKINAYCLEFLRRPPSPGTMFRIADQEMQEKFAPMRRILAASKRLQDAGLLNPDVDPLSYYHSTRQWAVWSFEQRFDGTKFEEAFIKRTKENFAAGGREWTKEIEGAVRSLVPNRWQDVLKVIESSKTSITTVPNEE